MTEMHSDVYGVPPAPAADTKTAPERRDRGMAIVLLAAGLDAAVAGALGIVCIVTESFGALAVVAIAMAFGSALTCMIGVLIILTRKPAPPETGPDASSAAAAQPWSTGSP